MKRWASWILPALLFLPTAGTSGPLDGPKRVAGLDLPGGFPGEQTFALAFEGGQRACVILKGDHRPIVNLGIEVYDEEKRLVAKDDGVGDYAAVIWYPPV